MDLHVHDAVFVRGGALDEAALQRIEKRVAARTGMPLRLRQAGHVPAQAADGRLDLEEEEDGADFEEDPDEV